MKGKVLLLSMWSVTIIISGLFSPQVIDVDYIESKPEEVFSLGATWWDENYTYRKECPVNNAVSGYQMWINVSKSSGGNVTTGGHCLDNFSDIRFVDSSHETVMDYWFERNISGQYAIAFVELLNANSSIYMYYGNASASRVSNMSATFPLYAEDFEDAVVSETLANHGFTVEGGNQHAYVVGANATTVINERNHAGWNPYNGSANNNNVTIDIVGLPDSFTMYGAVNIRHGGSAVLYMRESIGDGGLPINRLRFGPGNGLEIRNDGSFAVVYGTCALNTWYMFKWRVNVTDALEVAGVEFFNDRWDTLGIANYSSGCERSTSPYIFEILKVAEQGALFDQLAIGIHATVEPSWGSFGAEEDNLPGNTAPVNSNPVPVNQTTSVSLTPVLSIDIADSDTWDVMNQTFLTNASGSWVEISWFNNTDDVTVTCNDTSMFTGSNTRYHWRSNLSDGNGSWDEDEYWFETIDEPEDFGQPITKHDFLWNGTEGIFQTMYDLLNETDSDNVTELRNTDGDSWSGFKLRGGCSITNNGTDYIISYRERAGDTARGNNISIIVCPNGSTIMDNTSWTLIGKLNRSNVSGATIRSFERTCIRYWNSSYYLYFAADVSATWGDYMVKSATLAGLITQGETFGNWAEINPDRVNGKDPWVGYINGTYVLMDKNTSGNNYYRITTSDHPEFASGQCTQRYNYQEGSGKLGTNYICYNSTDQVYLAWGMERADPQIRWFWMYSKDLVSWTRIGNTTCVVVNPLSGDSGTARYADYYSRNETDYYIVMEYNWDNDSDSNELLLFNYSSVVAPAPAPNNAPYVSRTTPVDGATGVCLPLDLGVSVVENDTTNVMNISFWSNISGSWLVLGTNFSNVGNGTYYLNVGNFTNYNTAYHVTVNVTDGFTWSNNTVDWTSASSPCSSGGGGMGSRGISGGLAGGLLAGCVAISLMYIGKRRKR